MRGGGDLAQQLIQIEDRAEFLRQMRKRFQRAILAVHATVKARVVDRHGHARCNKLKQRPILFAIGGEPRGLQVDDAHQLSAGEHGHRQFALNRVERGQITRVATDVAR